MKKCFKCGIEKELIRFYKHAAMSDGHLNKCIECTKSDVSNREKTLRNTNPEWVISEKKRGREKYYKYGCKKPTYEQKKVTMQKYLDKYPEKKSARLLSQHIKPKTKNNHLHHWNYNQEFAKDVIELAPSCHAKLHRYMIYDQEQKMYRTLDGVLLDTRERHIEYYNSLANKD